MHQTIRVAPLLALAAVAACWARPKPKQLGDDPSYLPVVEVKAQESGPPAVVVQLPRAAHVNAFLVTPGEETVILYPTPSQGATRLAAGTHELQTAYGQRAEPAGDRILRRPGTGGGAPRTGGPDDFTMGVRRWVLVYSSEDSVPIGRLRDRVMGFTVPGYSDEALDTVARTVRSITPTGGWAALAIEVGL